VFSLAAAPATVVEMVQEWQRPPETSPNPQAMQPPDTLEAVLHAPVQDEAPDLARPVQLAALPPVPLAPQIDTRLPALPVTDQPPEQPKSDTADNDPAPRSEPDQMRRTAKPRQPEPPKAPTQPVADSPAKPKQKPKPPAPPPQPARKAAGTGNAPVAGTPQPKPRAATLSAGQRNALLADWGGKIKRKVLRRKRYPSGTNATGTASLRVTVSRDGRLAGVSLRKSSGNAALDRAAVQAVKRAGRFAKAPKGLTKASYSFTLALTFSR
jgi:protein TonB